MSIAANTLTILVLAIREPNPRGAPLMTITRGIEEGQEMFSNKNEKSELGLGGKHSRCHQSIQWSKGGRMPHGFTSFTQKQQESGTLLSRHTSYHSCTVFVKSWRTLERVGEPRILSVFRWSVFDNIYMQSYSRYMVVDLLWWFQRQPGHLLSVFLPTSHEREPIVTKRLAIYKGSRGVGYCP